VSLCPCVTPPEQSPTSKATTSSSPPPASSSSEPLVTGHSPGFTELFWCSRICICTPKEPQLASLPCRTPAPLLLYYILLVSSGETLSLQAFVTCLYLQLFGPRGQTARYGYLGDFSLLWYFSLSRQLASYLRTPHSLRKTSVFYYLTWSSTTPLNGLQCTTHSCSLMDMTEILTDFAPSHRLSEWQLWLLSCKIRKSVSEVSKT